MTTDNKRIRRNHSPELKIQILAECERPGASVAKIAMAHGINANVVHTWRKMAREVQVATPQSGTRFLPISVTPASLAEARRDDHVDIELHRAGLAVKLRWPLSAVEQFSTCMRELLR